MPKYFAGIGSRNIIDLDKARLRIRSVVDTALSKNIHLRSGGAEGSDYLFESYATLLAGDDPPKMEIFLPWDKFNNNKSPLSDVTPAMFRLTAKYHPAWNKLSGSVKRLHARNAAIVLGCMMDDPVQFIAYWKESDKPGGTDQALRIALGQNPPIKIFNLAKDEELYACLDHLDQML